MEKKKQNHVTLFMWYMFNVWNQKEATNIFGNDLGNHIYSKWIYYSRDSLRLYGELDNECRDKLVQRAIEYYEGK